MIRLQMCMHILLTSVGSDVSSDTTGMNHGEPGTTSLREDGVLGGDSMEDDSPDGLPSYDDSQRQHRSCYGIGRRVRGGRDKLRILRDVKLVVVVAVAILRMD